MTQLIAIIRDVKSEDIIEITDTLIESGINWIEVSLSDELKGLKCINKISKHYGDKIKLGAGTVTSVDQVKKVLDAGATYIITPGWDKELVSYIFKKDITVFPGVFSPGEIMQASTLGIHTVKLFPAASLGPEFIKNIKGPFPDMGVMAVGGINAFNINEYRKAGCNYFAIGSDLVPRGAEKNDKNKIQLKAQHYMKILKEASV